MSTPAGRWSSRWSESTVFGVGWWMSISRLCVRISKCSRESLSLNGERITQYTFFSVGSGTGPETVAPVRVAVSTISRAAVSIAEWSYALSRIRILFCVSEAMTCVSTAIRRRPQDAPRAGPLGPPPGSPAQLRPAAALLDDLGDHPRADGAPALADREAETLVHGDRLDQLDRHLDVVARHDHLGALGEVRHPGPVGRPEVELRPVAVEERRVAPALLLLQAVDLGLELGVRRDRAGLAEHLAALDLLALGAAERAADVVAGTTLVEDLAEHLDAGDHGLLGLRLYADDLYLLARLDDPLLDAAGGDGPAAGDREDVLDRHQERLVQRTLGLRDVVVELLGELEDLLLLLLVALERLQRRALHERDVVARELVLGQEVADLHLDQLEQLLVVDHVDLVQEDDDVGDAHLAGEQDVLTRLRHRPVGGGDDENGAVHLGGAGDHVLDVVRVARTVHVRVVTVRRLVLHVRGGDRDPALLLLGRVVDLLEASSLAAVLLGEDLRDGGGQRRLAVVDMPDRADVDVRLVALELLLRHWSCLLFRKPLRPARP